jgi:hypothetical protein
MSYANGPRIVTDGLVCCWDASNNKSYPGTGSTWYNIANNTVNLTKSGSPTHGVYAGTSCWRFTADGQYFTGTGMSAVTNGSNLTIEAVLYPENDVTSGDRATIIVTRYGSGGFYHSLNKSNRKISNYWYGKNPTGYHETGTALSNNNWHYTASVWNATDGKLYQYLNTTKTSITTTGTGYVQNTIIIGRESSARQYSGAIALLRIYNAPLNDSQILQNYNALKGRYGLS